MKGYARRIGKMGSDKHCRIQFRKLNAPRQWLEQNRSRFAGI